MRALITGITGFVGSHLAELLLGEGHEVLGTSLQPHWPAYVPHLAQRCRVFECDLTSRSSVERVLAETHPEAIYHLAAQAHVPESFRRPDETWAVNLGGTQKLYEAVRSLDLAPRILFVGSAAVYGQPSPEELPIDERCPLRPTSPYATSKAAADLLSYQSAMSEGLDIVRVRPFNHAGPRQSSGYAVSGFARQIAAIEQGRQEPVLRVGNLEARRDLTDVRDVVRGYAQLLAKGPRAEVYNLGSGRSYRIGDVLELLIRFSHAEFEVAQDPELVRSIDTSNIVANAGRLRALTGWEPQTAFEKTIEDTLNFWRKYGGALP